MAQEVVVTRRGQTTIPTKIRRRLGIEEGTRPRVESDGENVILTKVPSLFDLAGTSKLSRAEAFKRLDTVRQDEMLFDTDTSWPRSLQGTTRQQASRETSTTGRNLLSSPKSPSTRSTSSRSQVTARL